MFGLPSDWGGTINFATRIYEIKWVEKVAALVTLIPSSIIIAASGTGAFDKAIRKE